MGSATDPASPGRRGASRRLLPLLARWNRKLHYYLGLYLLFFLWLFSFTGLLLNHPKWTFTQYWPNRRQMDEERPIVAPAPGGDLAQAHDLMRQLALEGEIQWTVTRTDTNRFDFRVGRPGHYVEIKADLARNRVQLHRTDLNLLGITQVLHTFTGVRMDDDNNRRDWWLTSVWAFAMDATAAGCIFLVLSSLVMWFELPDKRVASGLCLLLGTLSCALFCIGLRWWFG